MVPGRQWSRSILIVHEDKRRFGVRVYGNDEWVIFAGDASRYSLRIMLGQRYENAYVCTCFMSLCRN